VALDEGVPCWWQALELNLRVRSHPSGANLSGTIGGPKQTATMMHEQPSRRMDMKTFRHAHTLAVLSGLLLLNACSILHPVARTPRFTEGESADFIARYYSDDTSFALKPSMMEGEFRSIFDRDGLLTLAMQQPQRELAVVVLIRYPSAGQEEAVKQGWLSDLKGLGYRRIVFLRAGRNLEVRGLPVLESPGTWPAIAEN
jgi:hypothetical protein